VLPSALEKIGMEVKKAALTKIVHGLPSMSSMAQRLTKDDK
jgi:hypothetical protein